MRRLVFLALAGGVSAAAVSPAFAAPSPAPSGATRSVPITGLPVPQLAAFDRAMIEVFSTDYDITLSQYSIYADDPSIRSYSYGGFDGAAIDAHGGAIASAPDLTRFLNAVAGTS